MNNQGKYIPMIETLPKDKLDGYKLAERKLYQALAVSELLSDSDIENVDPLVVLDTVRTIRDLISKSLDILADL